MKKKHRSKLLHEAEFVAEVPVDLIESEDDWSPYLSIDDAQKLDDVRAALRRGDLESAARVARIFRLIPVK